MNLITDASGIEEGLLVDVYWNLHKHVFSVRAVKSGLVIAHVPEINLSQVEFRVQKAGRERVLREKRKNVHAFVRGKVFGGVVEGTVPVRYNPYEADHFQNGRTGERVDMCWFARLKDRQVLARGIF